MKHLHITVALLACAQPLYTAARHYRPPARRSRSPLTDATYGSLITIACTLLSATMLLARPSLPPWPVAACALAALASGALVSRSATPPAIAPTPQPEHRKERNHRLTEPIP